jgi:hypothetical protein
MTTVVLPIKNRAVAIVGGAVPITVQFHHTFGGAVNRITIARRAGYQVLHTLGDLLFYATFVERASVAEIQGALYAPCDSSGESLAPEGPLPALDAIMTVGGFQGICVEAATSYVAGPVSAFSLRLVGVYA